MNFVSFYWDMNVIHHFFLIIAFLILGYILIRLLQKQDVKLKIWKIVVVLFVSLFAFSLKWSVYGTTIELPILPIGVWVLYFVMQIKGNQWQVYRTIAWLGFFGKFIILLATLLSIPVHHIVYPKEKLSTYIANIENASAITIHPSASDRSLKTRST